MKTRVRPLLAQGGDTVFVSVAAYCDPELPETLASLLLRAERPESLYIGLVWQGVGDPCAWGSDHGGRYRTAVGELAIWGRRHGRESCSQPPLLHLDCPQDGSR